MVSLALALGLADVIIHEVGGATLDTLFVDEGFGSLDADTLDDVMDTLDSLRDGGRVVGVVSHVAEMRDRIPTQLVVTKARTGSTVSPAWVTHATAREIPQLQPRRGARVLVSTSTRDNQGAHHHDHIHHSDKSRPRCRSRPPRHRPRGRCVATAPAAHAARAGVEARARHRHRVHRRRARRPGLDERLREPALRQHRPGRHRRPRRRQRQLAQHRRQVPRRRRP